MIMDNLTTYNEVIAKLAEAKKCQDEIIGCNNELQQVNKAIRGTANIQFYNQLKEQRAKLFCRIDEQIKDRDEKLNEALSKALDLADKDLENQVNYNNSKGLEAMATILSYMFVNYIKIKYSSEVILKQERIINRAAKEIKYQSFINQLRMLRW